MRITKYAKWIKTITTDQPTTPTLQIGVVYWGDTGNGNYYLNGIIEVLPPVIESNCITVDEENEFEIIEIKRY